VKRGPVALVLSLCASAAWWVVAVAAPPSAPEPTARTVYVSVVDKQGAALGDLTAADFSVKEGGKDYEITSAALATAPMQIAVIVDDNGTGAFRGGVAAFVQALLGKAEFSIVSVVGKVQPLTAMTNNTDTLRTAISGLIPRPGAQDGIFMLDGVLESLKVLEKRRNERPVVVVFSVGASEKSGTSPGEALRQLKQTMATMHVLSLSSAMVNAGGTAGKVGDLIDQNVSINQLLDEGPKQSGGRRAAVNTMPEVGPVVAKIVDQLTHQYAVSYKLPEGVKMNERLQVTTKRSGATVLAPTKIADK